MPSKKRPTKGNDIRAFFQKTSDGPDRSSTANTQPGGAAASQSAAPSLVRVKEEKGCDSGGQHSHMFTVKFPSAGNNEYTVCCNQPRTVLDAIKSNKKLEKMIKCADENIIIQLGKQDKKIIVATHFPCSCISEGESLIIHCKPDKVEEAQDQHYDKIHPQDQYSVFCIDTVGGLHTKTKELFRNSAVKRFKFLCVYGEKDLTVQEALKRDGRFINDLGDFELSDNDDPKLITVHTQSVASLDQKKFKICLPRLKNGEKQQENPPNDSQSKSKRRSVSDVVRQRVISAKSAVENQENGSNIEEIYEKLRQQFPHLKELMESRFPDNSYQEALSLRKENFGKVQQSFSEIHRVRKLLILGESVCKIIVKDGCQGTGFVLFDKFILTNAHLFKGYVTDRKLQADIDVYVLFNYDDPEPNTNYYYFTGKKTFVDIDEELDYAILELHPEGQSKAKNIKVPPGLMETFGPLPQNGEACIIGHPGGDVKKMDPTCIIEKENRGEAVKSHLHGYKDYLFIVQSISEVLRNKGIENIMVGGKNADGVVTYHTSMYHGASGSPVFDAVGRVFGLHTSGFCYGFLQHKESVIECAIPVLTIFAQFVDNLRKRGEEELLKKVQEAAKKNQHLLDVLNADQPMEVD